MDICLKESIQLEKQGFDTGTNVDQQSQKGVRTLKSRAGWRFVISMALVQWLCLTQTQAAEKLRGFPVKLDDMVDTGSMMVFDIDDDGQLEILVGTRNKLHALELDGHAVKGFPLKWEAGIELSTPLSAGRWGREKLPVVFFGTEDGRLVALKGDGSVWPGFPLGLTSALSAAATLADVDGDGISEIVFGTKDGYIHVVRADGKELSGYPSSIRTAITTVVTLGKFRPRDASMLFFGDADGNLHAWNGPGQEIEGFPFKARYSLTGQPVFGDIDDDGNFEVIFGSKDYRVYALKEKGIEVEGFPVETGYRIYSTCALADIDGDNVTDIVTTSGDGKIYAIGAKGKVLNGFPIITKGRLKASPVVGDVDGDGKTEIAVGTDQGQLVIYRHNGSVYPGFPIAAQDRIEIAPVLSDINGDGLIEFFGVSKNAVVSAVRMIRKGGAKKQLAWPSEGRDCGRSGMTYPNPPRYVDLSLDPPNPATTDTVTLGYRYFDLDGDTEPNTVIKWYRNGKHVNELNGNRQLSASVTRKHEVWYATLQADSSNPIFKSPSIKIVNTPPGSPKIKLLPANPRTQDKLTMHIEEKSIDVDNDTVRYDIVWIKDQEPQKKMNKAFVPGKETASGQVWTVVVTPHDGQTAGVPARLSRTIVNTAPMKPMARLEPGKPTVAQDVKVVITKEAQDADGDRVSYLYDWKVDEKPLNLERSASVMPAGLAVKHSLLTVVVTSHDGIESGESVSLGAKIINTVPTAPKVMIVPPNPQTGDELGVEIVQPAFDPDRDPIDYQVKWQSVSSKGSRGPSQSVRLASEQTKKSDVWKVIVTPSDGESMGSLGSANVTIRNTPPVAPQVHASQPRPQTSQDLILEIEKPAWDADKDLVSVEVVWFEEDREVARGKDMYRFPFEKTSKNKRYMAKLIPFDGADKGRESVQWFEVLNTPPSGCEVLIQPQEPVSKSALQAVVSKKPLDKDGDEVRLKARWYCNDERVDSGEKPMMVDAARVLRDQRWTVVLTPFDGEEYGPSCMRSVLVKNSPPIAPEFSLQPVKPTTLDTLSVNIEKPSIDPDEDTVELRYEWYVNGRVFPTAGSTASISKGLLKKGQNWEVVVTASDGRLTSNPVKRSTQIDNTPPSTPQVTIEPKSPASHQELACRLRGPTIDYDGDRVSHAYSWYLVKGNDDVPKGPPAHQGPNLPGEKVKKGQYWMCKVVAHDGVVGGGDGSYRVQVTNSPPSTPRAEIRTESNRGLQCVVTIPGIDPDGDQVEYLYKWFKDGIVQTMHPKTNRLDKKLTNKNDIWRCAVVATDGQLNSAFVETRDILIENR